MDWVAGLLDGPRAREAFLLRSLLDPPYAIRVQDQAPLTLLAVVRGQAWVLPRRGEPVLVGAGDAAVLRGPAPYTVADPPDTAPDVIIHPDQRCTSVGGGELAYLRGSGVRTWGNSPDGETVLLTGTYQLPGETGQRLLTALPELLTVSAPGWSGPLMPYLAEEVGKDEPGQEAVLDRLLDLLLITALRAWFARPEAPSWYRAEWDPVVGPALRLLRHDPAHPWTVAALARAAGVSRAVLARRFRELVGEPPMAFLTGLRLTLAADLLREPGATVSSVARKVGYGSPYALSAAFKRVRGVSPRGHRAG